MKLEPNIVYRVTNSNTDKSILLGDLVYIDDNGVLVVNRQGELAPSVAHVCFEKNEQTQDVMDFEVECNYE